MHVVEHQDKWPPCGCGFEELADRPGDVIGDCRYVAQSYHRRDLIPDEFRIGPIADDAKQFPTRSLGGVGLHNAGSFTHHLGDGPVGDVPPIRKALTNENRKSAQFRQKGGNDA
jgi:hypothetical protein